MAWSRRNVAPVLYFEIDGKPANDLLRYVKSFTYKATVNKTTEVKIAMNNFATPSLLDDPRLGVNIQWRVRFGYTFDMSPILPLVVRGVEPTYGAERGVTFILHDHGSALGKDSAARNWGRVASSEIARAMAAEYGLIASDIQDSPDAPTKAFMQPGSVTNLEYLHQLASAIDWEVSFEGSPVRLIYRPKAYGSAPVGRLTYFDNPSETSYVLSFEPKIKSLGPVKSGASGASTKAGETGKAADAKETGASPLVRFSMVNGGRTTNPTVIESAGNKGTTTPIAAGSNSRSVAGTLRAQLLDKANEASSKHPLTPSLVVGKLYEWAGLDAAFNREWYSNEVTHTLSGSAMSTSVSWKRDAPKGKGSSGKDKKDDKSKTEASPVVRQNLNGSQVVVAQR